MRRLSILMMLFFLHNPFAYAQNNEFQGFLNIIDALQTARADNELIRLSRSVLMNLTGLYFISTKAGKEEVFESDALVAGTDQARFTLRNHRATRISYLYFYFTANIEPLKKSLLQIGLQYKSQSSDVEDRTIWHYQGDRIYISIYDCPLRDKDPNCMKSAKVYYKRYKL